MDFSLIMFIALLVTGGIVLLYKIYSTARGSGRRLTGYTQPVRSEPVIVEYARSLFPIVLVVFVLRSFVVEPFRIPSGSMLPSLHIGDFILVNKYTYGIRLPILNTKVAAVGLPERGDVMVFRYPLNPELNFIKRVIGLPGDTLSYVDKKLTINGQTVHMEPNGQFIYKQAKMRGKTANQIQETIDDSVHQIILDEGGLSRNLTEVNVPEGHYFVMGDNRDHSNDSRFWRFVPESHVVGKAFFIWFSWKSTGGGGVEWSRIGTSIE